MTPPESVGTAKTTVASARGSVDSATGENWVEKEAQDVLKAIPFVGGFLAFVARRAGLAAALVGVFCLVVLPIILPLLTAMYVKFLPESVRSAYTKFVTDAFSVESDITERVDDAVARFVSANNDRLDFVQQFSQVWSKGGDTRTPVYTFPLETGQDINIVFSAHSQSRKPECTDPKKIAAADNALNSADLFSISAMGKERFKWGFAQEDAGSAHFGEKFWNTSQSEFDQVKTEKKMAVQVLMNAALVDFALECYVVRSNLLITVSKTISPVSTKRPTAIPSSIK